MHTIKKQLHEVTAGDKIQRGDGTFARVERVTLAPANRAECLKPIALILSDERGRYSRGFGAEHKYAEVTVIPKAEEGVA